MRRVFVILLALTALVVIAGCGSKSTSPAQKQEAKAEAVKFEAQAKRCLPTNGGVVSIKPLRSKAGRKRFVNCMVPLSQQRTFKLCLQKAVFSGGLNKTKIEASANACLKKVS